METIKERVARVREVGRLAREAGGAKKGHRAAKVTGFRMGQPSKRALMFREGERAKDGVLEPKR